MLTAVRGAGVVSLAAVAVIAFLAVPLVDTTVVVATGGIEQNGPYLATGKHNYVLRATCPAIAKKLGNALCAPIVPFVPEGDIEPPSGMMRYPGTISVTSSTYESLLTDIASSLKQHGFEHIVLIGDSGGNQEGMKRVASELSEKWKGSAASIHYVPEYYMAKALLQRFPAFQAELGDPE